MFVTNVNATGHNRIENFKKTTKSNRQDNRCQKFYIFNFISDWLSAQNPLRMCHHHKTIFNIS